MNRRRFLGAAADLTLFPSAFVTAANKRRKVVIAGGGLSGLSCAYELRKLGFEAIVLEGQGRPGCRIQTLREGMDPELVAEAGATRIPDTHELTLSYVHQFGLTLEPFKGRHLADVVRLRGQNCVVGHGFEPNWRLQLSPQERRLGLAGVSRTLPGWPLKPREWERAFSKCARVHFGSGSRYASRIPRKTRAFLGCN
jgi:monoamine oxidase